MIPIQPVIKWVAITLLLFTSSLWLDNYITNEDDFHGNWARLFWSLLSLFIALNLIL